MNGESATSRIAWHGFVSAFLLFVSGIVVCLILGLYVPLLSLISLPILFASMMIFARDGFYFYPSEGTELSILAALVQMALALTGPGAFRITPPKWLPRVPLFPAIGP
jgi:uncharacterized membrane protein YphA (DoxX/SURF4 family)